MKNTNHFLQQSKIVFAFVTLLAIGGCGSPNEIQFPVEVGVKPESITKGFNDNYYVTIINGNEPGDGSIVEISQNGVRTFFEGCDDPKGIVYLDGHLYFADLAGVWKVDQSGQGEVFADNRSFPEEVLYLNDVAVDARGEGLYVSDMGAKDLMRDSNNTLWPLGSEEAGRVPALGRIYHVDLSGRVTLVQDTSALMLNPNGVGVDNQGNIIIGGFFLGNILVQKNGQLTPLKGRFRGVDAVEQDSKGNYYASSWPEGKAWKIDGKTEEATLLIDGLKSAADFYLEEDKGRLLLPDMVGGVIYSVDIN